jgi:hypothetical protein
MISIQQEAGGDRPEQIRAVLEKERKCESFTEWIPGFTPKEHKEMLDAKEMRAWQAEQREKDLAWQAAQRQEERTWQESQKRIDRRLQFVTIVFAALVSAIVSWLTTNLIGKSGP